MEILQRALREALNRNDAETVRWTQYKEQHEGAQANIEKFNKSLEVDIMVPIGTKALIPGRLYHTNEIVVSHSGTYYSKCTAHKALEICQHRLSVAATRLEALEAEACMHRNQLDLPLDFDAFSSQEIIETYDEEQEKRWQVNHKKKMKEHKRVEAIERQKLMDGKAEDDIITKLDVLELMEELENELEAISAEEGEENEAIQAALNGSVRQTSHKKRISHCNDQVKESVSLSMEKSFENNEMESGSSNSADDDDDDDDDIPIEFKEIELEAASMTNAQKLKLFKKKLAEVEDYLHNCRPRTIEEISRKTDQMFLSDHLLNAIETIEDELSCDQFLNGGNVVNQDSDDDALSAVCSISVPKQTKTILKKKISFASNDEVKWFEEPSKLSTRKVSFASEDEVKTFDVKTDELSKLSTKRISIASEDDVESSQVSADEPRKSSTRRISFAAEDDVKSFDVGEKPSKISSTVIFDSGPVLNLNVNHSEAVFNATNEQSNVIRSPVDIYKQFAGCTLNESQKEQRDRAVPKNKVENSSNQLSTQEIKEQQPADQDIVEANTEVKELLDNMFGTKNANEPDPLPGGNFVDFHQPKKRVSLFKQRRQMKSQ